MRNDIHSVSRFIAADYDYVLGYAVGTSGQPSYRMDCTRPQWDGAARQVIPGHPHAADGRCCVTSLREAGARFVNGAGRCTVCGAAFGTGEVWCHRETGDHVHLGWECADKFGAVSGDRDAALAYRAAMAEARSRNAKEKKLATARDTWLAAHPETAKALEGRNLTPDPTPAKPACPTHGEFVPYADTNEYWVRQDLANACYSCTRIENEANRARNPRNNAIAILADLYRKLHRYGSLSPKQEAFAVSLATRAAAPTVARVEKPKATAPTGKGIVFEGRVVAVKESVNDWGTTWRWTAVVETPEGEWVANGTVPAGSDLNRGDRIRVKATLVAGSEAHFVFAKRPRVEVLSPAVEAV